MALGRKLLAATRSRRQSPRANAGVPGNFVPGIGQRDWNAGAGREYDSSSNPRKQYGPRPTRAPYRPGERFARHPTRRTPGSRSRRGRPTVN